MIPPKLQRILSRLKPSGGIAERAVKSTIWILSQNVAGRIIQLTMLLILARLIGPSEIGLMGIVLLALSALRRFTNIGLDAALIQRDEDNVDDHLNTTWLLMIARGLVIALVLVLAAPLVAALFNEPRAEPMIQVIGLSPLLLGLKNPGVVYFQKNLTFHKQFVYRISGEVIQFAVAVGYALVEPTAWAFVVGYVVSDAFRLVFSYVIHGYRPWPSFDRTVASELIDFGKWMTGSSILYFLYSEGDDAFVGWLLGPASLAFYQYAYRFSNAPATELSQVLSQVMFPTLSKMQNDQQLLQNTFLRTVQLTALTAIPMAFGIIVVSPSFVQGFFGSEWTPMVPAMMILSLYGLLRAFGKLFGSIWKAVGRPDYVTKLSFVRVVLLAIVIYPLSLEFGITGTALAVTGLYVFPMLPLNLYFVMEATGISIVKILKQVFYPLVASTLMALGLWYVHLSLELAAIAKFSVLVLLGAVVYVGIVAWFEHLLDIGIKGNLSVIMSNVRS